VQDVAIRADGLGKRYTISQRRERYVALRDVIADRAGGLIRRMRGRPTPEHAGDRQTLWALRDVSFELAQGERLGIIGRNGAGKSTLLKILSRITHPTEGEVRLRGRVASLLEVGTGFHPELTGRENVYLNGTILGIGRREINARFRDIVEFAEVERFLDTPVKRYSSGMYVRLAFAVAAHLEPEILLVDEVLAVGDAAFQRKCLGKMTEVAKGGRTVILVSHNMVAIEELSTTVMWIDGGRVRRIGSPRAVTDEYTATAAGQTSGEIDARAVSGDGTVELLSYRALNGEGDELPLPRTGEDVRLRVRLRLATALRHVACGLSVWNERGVLMTSINSVQQGLEMGPWPAGELELEVRLGTVPYLAGRYRVDFWVMSPQSYIYAQAEGAIEFEIAQSAVFGSTSQVGPGWGVVYADVSWGAAEPVR
jgi:lipopolysaccharide transport system ATP-binding protein